MAVPKIVRRTLRQVGYELRSLGRIGDDKIRDLRRIFGDEGPRVIFDVGANTGQTAVLYARRFPGARIFSFEPDPAAFERLKANVAPYPGVEPVDAALGERDGSAPFRINTDDTTSSFLPTAAEATRFWPAERFAVREVRDVAVRTLDGFCAEKGLGTVDLLKLDAQGYELRILDGARALLERKAFRCIYTELLFVPFYEGQAFYHEVCARLSRDGYRLVALYDLVHGAEGYLSWCDGLFVRG